MSGAGIGAWTGSGTGAETEGIPPSLCLCPAGLSGKGHGPAAPARPLGAAAPLRGAPGLYAGGVGGTRRRCPVGSVGPVSRHPARAEELSGLPDMLSRSSTHALSLSSDGAGPAAQPRPALARGSPRAGTGSGEPWGPQPGPPVGRVSAAGSSASFTSRFHVGGCDGWDGPAASSLSPSQGCSRCPRGWAAPGRAGCSSMTPSARPSLPRSLPEPPSRFPGWPGSGGSARSCRATGDGQRGAGSMRGTVVGVPSCTLSGPRAHSLPPFYPFMCS